jgi:hypothetical protein
MAQTNFMPGFAPNFIANTAVAPAVESHPGLPPHFLANLPSGGAYAAYHPGLPPATVPYRYTGRAV